MTTIAYKDGILAVDRLGSWGEIIEQTDNKIRLFKDKRTAIAVSGRFTSAFYFMDWYKDWDVGNNSDRFVPLSTDEGAEFSAVVVQLRRGDEIHVEYWNQRGYPIACHQSYDAWGSGAEVALGAMYAEATAIDAVLAAGKHLCHTGFGCRYVDFNRSTLNIRTADKGET